MQDPAGSAPIRLCAVADGAVVTALCWPCASDHRNFCERHRSEVDDAMAATTLDEARGQGHTRQSMSRWPHVAGGRARRSFSDGQGAGCQPRPHRGRTRNRSVRPGPRLGAAERTHQRRSRTPLPLRTASARGDSTTCISALIGRRIASLRLCAPRPCALWAVSPRPVAAAFRRCGCSKTPSATVTPCDYRHLAARLF